jgi:hypothetical protein
VLIAVTGLVLRRSRTPSAVGTTESDGVGAQLGLG